MKNFFIQMPEKIYVGYSKSKEIGEIVKKSGNKKLLVVVDEIHIKLNLIDHIFKSLKNSSISYTVFPEIDDEPTITKVDSILNDLDISSKFDGVVGIGGGSTLDVAKLLAVSEAIEGTVKNYFDKEIGQPGLQSILIPTTAGTGSEATPNSILKDKKENTKKGLVSPYLIPDIVILDPGLTTSLPPKITAETGIDAFTHAIECFICNKANDVSNLFALDAIRLISNNLRQAVNNGEDIEARYNMMLGSFYGGVAITNSGTGGVHALAYPLGSTYGLSHGLSNSILLPSVMEFNSEAVPEKFLKVAGSMGIRKTIGDKMKTVNKVVEEIKLLVEDVGINVEGLDVSMEEVEELANSAMDIQRLLKNNPRVINYEDAKKIYKEVLVG